MDEITREVELDCEPERAWRALTEESELGEWLGGEVEADLRPGGEITVTGDDGETRQGFFETIETGREVSFWWSDATETESSRVELELLPAVEGDGCVVRVTESRPMVELERELAKIAGGLEGGTGPIASMALAAA
jgi:uncharacterized protein YndB with AHSA1/START domain